MDVLVDGSVSFCKLFFEFSVGNLYEKGVVEIWYSENFKKVRGIIYGSLIFICFKCVLFYCYGI